MASAKKYAEAAIAELVAAFPDAFTPDPTLVRPLKLGIKDDIYARFSMSRRRITAALRAYCNSAQYLAVCKEGAVRVDPTGSPAGVVTATEAEYAGAAQAQPSARRAGKITSGSRTTRELVGVVKRKQSLPRQTVIGEGSKALTVTHA